MWPDWWQARVAVRKINFALLNRQEFTVRKAKDHLKLGVHWYNIASVVGPDKTRVRGSGVDFSEHLAIARAWGEFVERYSFLRSVTKTEYCTSNGFASHVNVKSSAHAAIGELVERDALLCCWLARLPAVPLDVGRLKLRNPTRDRLALLEARGFQVKFAVLAFCMGFFVGLAILSDGKNIGIATSAKTSTSLAVDALTREVAQIACSWRSPLGPTPIEELPEQVRPIDHARFYLQADTKSFFNFWFGRSRDQQLEFPSFDYTVEELTSSNPYAQETGYSVHRAVSKDCQNLWFGETREDWVNLRRLSAVLGRPITYGELNHAPHPLA
ncbi:MAG: YcaO-like family protein [Deltaproteobacteria bacterium]|nr:YcaO-like family protein [Deltaproteobacteria bacterium]